MKLLNKLGGLGLNEYAESTVAFLGVADAGAEYTGGVALTLSVNHYNGDNNK